MTELSSQTSVCILCYCAPMSKIIDNYQLYTPSLRPYFNPFLLVIDVMRPQFIAKQLLLTPLKEGIVSRIVSNFTGKRGVHTDPEVVIKTILVTLVVNRMSDEYVSVLQSASR